jgi:hypothetical protein
MNPFSLDHIFPATVFPWPCTYRASAMCAFAPCTGAFARGSILRQISPLARAESLSGATWTDSSAFVLPSLALSKSSLFTASAARVLLEVWGLEPQTYGLQSHRSSH